MFSVTLLLYPEVSMSAVFGQQDRLSLRLLKDPPGVVHAPARPNPGIVIHMGPSVHISCDRGGYRHRGLSVHGDVDIVPAGTASRWEMKSADMALLLSLPASLIRRVAEEANLDPTRLELVNRFQIRDRQIEHIGWALKAEMDAEYANGRLYLDSLAAALAVHLLNHHSSHAHISTSFKSALSGHRLREVLSYIEDNLTDDLSLKDIAAVAGLSVSHCKTAFRNSVGQPIHQYVIQRRVERARALLNDGSHSIRDVAQLTGFAHQSHLALHMRRLLGVSPKTILRG